jgi:hypothetical protein
MGASAVRCTLRFLHAPDSRYRRAFARRRPTWNRPADKRRPYLSAHVYTESQMCPMPTVDLEFLPGFRGLSEDQKIGIVHGQMKLQPAGIGLNGYRFARGPDDTGEVVGILRNREG